jgi:site-specific DNA recombinase
MGYSPRLDQDYKAATALQMQLLADRARIAEESDELPVFPPLEELKRMAREVGDLGLHEREFCTTMRLLMPKITVYPYQLLDGGQVVLRAVAEVNLAPLVPDGQRWIGDRLRGHFCLDLFEPPQRAVYMRRIAEKRAAGWTERRIAAEYNLTITAVQRAMVLYRMMTAAGLDDPYVHLTQPPADGGKLQRHLHPRYQFRPLEGYPSEPPIE